MPKVAGLGEPPNPIDAFVREAQAEAGIAPSPEADRVTLIRRPSIDLRGLPPTPGEVDAFETDARSDAYERLVDRALASTAFGERQSQRWLDLARYADTDGGRPPRFPDSSTGSPPSSSPVGGAARPSIA